jgi:hypothetical protein
MIKRAEAQKAMGGEALVVMKKLLSHTPSIPTILKTFDSSNRGYITRSDIKKALSRFPPGSFPDLSSTASALNPSNSPKIDTVEFGSTLRRAEGELNNAAKTAKRQAIWEERFKQAEKAALAELDRQEASYTADELGIVIEFMDPDKVRPRVRERSEYKQELAAAAHQ